MKDPGLLIPIRSSPDQERCHTGCYFTGFELYGLRSSGFATNGDLGLDLWGFVAESALGDKICQSLGLDSGYWFVLEVVLAEFDGPFRQSTGDFGFE